MSDHAQHRLHLALLAVAALLLAFSLGAVARIGAEALDERSRPASETRDR